MLEQATFLSLKLEFENMVMSMLISIPDLKQDTPKPLHYLDILNYPNFKYLAAFQLYRDLSCLSVCSAVCTNELSEMPFKFRPSAEYSL